MSIYEKLQEIGLIALFVLVIAAFIALIVGIAYGVEAVEAERATWFADCIERGNDPTWCRESEEQR